jgi:hypothetical protein
MYVGLWVITRVLAQLRIDEGNDSSHIFDSGGICNIVRDFEQEASPIIIIPEANPKLRTRIYIEGCYLE